MRRALQVLPFVLAGLAAQAAEERGRVVVSPVQEDRLGELERDQFLATHPVSPEGSLAIHVDEVGHRVARTSERPGVLYHFLVLQGTTLQAHSFIGGTVCVTEALARLDDDRLAFAIGHELAHVSLQHHVARYRLWIRSGADLEPAPADLAALLADFDRDQEMEADRYGALYAVRAGYSFASSVAMLELLLHDAPVTADRAHPPFDERIAALRGFEDELRQTLRAFHQGTDAVQGGRFDEAIRQLRTFVREFPYSTSGRINLGLAYLGRVQSASPLEVAVVLPTLPEPGIVIRSGYDRRDLEQARQQFERALEVQPTEVHALIGLAWVLARLEDLEQARARLTEALRIAPQQPEALLCLGNVEFLARNYDAAAESYLGALTLRPDWAPALENLELVRDRQRLTRAPESP